MQYVRKSNLESEISTHKCFRCMLYAKCNLPQDKTIQVRWNFIIVYFGHGNIIGRGGTFIHAIQKSCHVINVNKSV
mgnify:FL=1